MVFFLIDRFSFKYLLFTVHNTKAKKENTFFRIQNFLINPENTLKSGFFQD